MAEKDQPDIEQAAIVAHQIKSPVSTLQQILRTLLGGFAGEFSERQRAILQSADRKADEAMATIKGLLALADAQAADADSATDLAASVRDACERYRSDAAQKQIELACRAEEDHAWVSGARGAIQEAVVALVDNAVKYTPDGGRVVVELEVGDETASLRVADSGIGIPQDELDRLFTPFFRASNARKLVSSGTGLGLSFVHAVVDAAGGSVEAGRSDLGGAQFTMTLPRAAAPEGAAQAREHARHEPTFRAVVIGGVAAGPKIAARIMRLAPGAQVTIIEKGRVLSYAGCGLPYYISGQVTDQSRLLSTAGGIVRGPEYFERVKNVRVMHRTEALEIDREGRRVRVHDLISGEESWLPYDRLALATGSLPIVPEIPGVELDGVFTLHGLEHAEGIRDHVAAHKAMDVTIVGGGLIGVEMTESLVDAGCRVTLVEMRPQLLRGLDWEMAEHVRMEFERRGVRVVPETRVTGFQGEERVRQVVTKNGSWPADLVIMGVGVRPNSELAIRAGLDVCPNGGICVDQHMRTSDPDIYAAGDCVESRHMLTHCSTYAPYGGIANRQGRVAADSICGVDSEFPGVLDTAICKTFTLTVGRTGLTEEQAREMGYEVVTAHVAALDRAHFMPQADVVMIKLVADASDRSLLGLQAIGRGEVSKRLDVAVTAISARMTIDEVANLDLGYAPAYSTAMDCIHTACNVVRNKLGGQMQGIGPRELHEMIERGDELCLLDVRTHGEVNQQRLSRSMHIPLPALRARIGELPGDEPIVVYSWASMSAYEASIILRDHGLEQVRVLDGGLAMWPYDRLNA